MKAKINGVNVVLSLEKGSFNEVTLVARTVKPKGIEWSICGVTLQGDLVLYDDAGEDIGLTLDDNGCIKVIEEMEMIRREDV